MKWAVLIGVFLLLVVLFVIAGSPRDIFKTKVVASHEVSAIVNLRPIAERQDAFRRTHNGSFADALPLLDGVRPIDYGYAYSFQAIRRDERGSVTGYVVTASPTVRDKRVSGISRWTRPESYGGKQGARPMLKARHSNGGTHENCLLCCAYWKRTVNFLASTLKK